MIDQKECKVNLANYYGPLDLLLHLVKSTEVDITAIKLADACEQYIGFLKAMDRLDINLSGEFLALSSQLLLIKSRALAPAPVEEEEEDEEDGDNEASLDLIRKLLEYRRIKDRARALGQMGEERTRRFSRPRIRIEGEPEPEPLRNLELWDLVLLFSRVEKSTRLETGLSILYRDIPLEVFVESILKRLEDTEKTNFTELVGDRKDRAKVIGTFLAILELTKEQRIQIEQHGDKTEIHVERAG